QTALINFRDRTRRISRPTPTRNLRLFVTGQVAAFVVPPFGWPAMFVVGGVPGLVIAAMMLPESPRWLRPRYRVRTLVVWLLWASQGFFVNGRGNWMPVLYSSIYGRNLKDSLRAGTLNTMIAVIVLAVCAVSIDRVGRRRWIGRFLDTRGFSRQP